MGITTAQLQEIAKFTFGGAITHHVESVTEEVSLERVGDETADAFRVHRFIIKSFIEGSDLDNLKTKLDLLTAGLAISGQDFALYRGPTKTREILASAAHHGPSAKLQLTGELDAGNLQSFTVTVTARVPVTVTAGLIAHAYSESSTTDDDGDVTVITRSGEITSKVGTSAKTLAEDNFPAQPAGFIRTTSIDTDDTDTRATYIVADAETPYRNEVVGILRTHTYTDTTSSVSGDVRRTARAGHVETLGATQAEAWINANLPALDSDFKRTVDISVDDTGKLGDYTVTDELIANSGDLPPGVNEGRVDVQVTNDAQRGKVVVTSGRYVGPNAAAEVANVRALLSNITREQVKTNTLGDGAIDFSYTSLFAENSDDFLSWQESITISGGGYAKSTILHPDRAPFVVNGVQLPYVVNVSGSAKGLTKYVAPPGLLAGLEDNIDGQPQWRTTRNDDFVATTTWQHRYILAADPGVIKPRNPVIVFLP